MRYLISGTVEKYHAFSNARGFREVVIIISDVKIDGITIQEKIQMPVGKWCNDLAPGNHITFMASLDLDSKMLQPKRPYLKSRRI